METDRLPSTNNGRQSQYGAITNSNLTSDDISTSPPSSITDTTTSSVDVTFQMTSTLNIFEKVGFGLGHVYNDLSAGVWFSYTLLFMQGALNMSATVAGALVMFGQVGDAVATPIVGLLADKYGTKRGWHIAGTMLTFLTFPLIFSLCPFCVGSPFWWTPLYFSICILLFQLGWATVQITHLAMISELSRTQKDRSDLTAIRYSSGVCSNVVVYVVMWAVLHGGKSKTNNNITPEDAYRFRDISLILTLIGLSMVVLFHFSLAMTNYEQRRRQALLNSGYTHAVKPEEASDNEDEPADNINAPLLESRENVANKHSKNFLKSPLLYLNAFLYVFSRLFMTTSLIYIPLWLDERSFIPAGFGGVPQLRFANGTLPATIGALVIDDSVEHIATVPLVSFLASFVASMFIKSTRQWMGHKMGYLLGSITSLLACGWVLVAASSAISEFQLFSIASLFGAGSSITMIASLSITADMIGRHAAQAGFIYSAVTFADKLITGIAVVTIESVKCDDRMKCPEYYRSVLAYACGFAAIFGLITLVVLIFTKYYMRERRLNRRQAAHIN